MGNASGKWRESGLLLSIELASFLLNPDPRAALASTQQPTNPHFQSFLSLFITLPFSNRSSK